MSLFADDMTVRMENPMQYAKKSVSKFSKIEGYKNQHTELFIFPVYISSK